ncbi:MAG: DAK2 domain-containing protein [Chloroflexi bacterium]|nr:DAK2 domain-containing protein [Chloroflexota bacterium]
MFDAGTSWLEKNAQAINALNVFPVPDGDTGTNMLLTMRATMEEAYRASNETASSITQSMAYGSLMGARGNSGVILSQIFRGFSKSLAAKESLFSKDLAQALEDASSAAYKSVSKPVEGTILTVVRDASVAAKAKAESNTSDVTAVLEATVRAAKVSVATTPSLLPVLREAGVVDAGGQGLYVLLEGALRFLKGRAVEKGIAAVTMRSSPGPCGKERSAIDVKRHYGYCTELLIGGKNLDIVGIREKIGRMGDSTLVVGDETAVRIHVHTFEPGPVVSYATSLGVLHQVKVDNIDDQHLEFLQVRSAERAVDIATVAVVHGEGLTQIFKSLGVTSIVSGGQTMNPSAEEILQAIEGVSSDKVVVLPNNKNVVMTAQQACSLTKKEAEVVPTHSLPQGIAALLAFNAEANFESNLETMKAVVAPTRTLELTRAVRSAEMGGVRVEGGQAIGFIDGELVAAGERIPAVLYELLEKCHLKDGNLVTLYYGGDTEKVEAERVAQNIRRDFPGVEVELVWGGQPHYNYIVSVE